VVRGQGAAGTTPAVGWAWLSSPSTSADMVAGCGSRTGPAEGHGSSSNSPRSTDGEGPVRRRGCAAGHSRVWGATRIRARAAYGTHAATAHPVVARPACDSADLPDRPVPDTAPDIDPGIGSGCSIHYGGHFDHFADRPMICKCGESGCHRRARPFASCSAGCCGVDGGRWHRSVPCSWHERERTRNPIDPGRGRPSCLSTRRP
jgi:hypothetical protein